MITVLSEIVTITAMSSGVLAAIALAWMAGRASSVSSQGPR